MRLGCDPEIFLVDAVNHQYISAIDKIGGSKMFPRPLPIGDGFAVQEDNVALEYNIPPAETADDFVNKINTIMQFLSEEVANMGLTFSKESATFFPDKELQDPRALEFGCDPDFNAWTNRMNPRPQAADKTLRSCGGHVHVGAQVDHIPTHVRMMDLFLGVPSVLMDSGELRKKLYGKAGAFRVKPYGFEYRTLSNFWIFHPELIKWVWNNTSLALNAKHIPVNDEKKIILDAINNNNKDAAQHLVDKYNIPVTYA